MRLLTLYLYVTCTYTSDRRAKALKQDATGLEKRWGLTAALIALVDKILPIGEIFFLAVEMGLPFRAIFDCCRSEF